MPFHHDALGGVRGELSPLWFELSDSHGIGVTAVSELDAFGLAEPVRIRYWRNTTIMCGRRRVDARPGPRRAE